MYMGLMRVAGIVIFIAEMCVVSSIQSNNKRNYENRRNGNI